MSEDELRRQLDRLDRRIVALRKKRAELAQQIMALTK